MPPMPIPRAQALFSATTSSSLRCYQRLQRIQRPSPILVHSALLAGFSTVPRLPQSRATRRNFHSSPIARDQGAPSTPPPSAGSPDDGSLNRLTEERRPERDKGAGVDGALSQAKDTATLGQNGEEKDAKEGPAEPAATGDRDARPRELSTTPTATTATSAKTNTNTGSSDGTARPLGSHTSSPGHAAAPSPSSTMAAALAAGHRRRSLRARAGRHSKASAEGPPPLKLPGWLIHGNHNVVLAEPGLSGTQLAEKMAISTQAWWGVLELAKMELKWILDDKADRTSESVALPTKTDALQTISLCYMLALTWNNSFSFDSGPEGAGGGADAGEESIGPPAAETRRREMLESWIEGYSELLKTYPNILRDSKDWATACGPHSKLREDRLKALQPSLGEEAERWMSDLPSVLAEIRQGPLGVITRLDPTGRGHDDLDAECASYTELVASVRAGLASPFPGISVLEAPESPQGAVIKRPMTVLAVLNYPGRQVAREVMTSVATDLGADIVHLDACSLAKIVGGYLEQSAYWNRGPVSMLGYAVAEYNGRLLPRPNNRPEKLDRHDESGEQQQQQQQHQDSQRKRAAAHAAGTVKDEQWDNTKTYHALKTLLEAPSVKRRELLQADEAGIHAASADDEQPTPSAEASAEHPTPSTEASAEQKQEPNKTKHPDLIIHLLDYAELEIEDETARLSSKLREVVDRLWLQGRRVVLVGSTSGNITSEEPQHREWRELVADLEFEEDCHQCVPYRTSAKRPDLARLENGAENMMNVYWQIWAMTGMSEDNHNVVLDVDDKLKVDEYVESFTCQVYDVQWAQRLATLVVSKFLPVQQEYPILMAYREMLDRDKVWAEHYPAAANAPYFSPLTLPPGADSDPSHPSELDSPSFGGSSGSSNNSNNHVNINTPPHLAVNQIEANYINLMIKPENLRTTFADIVLPEETKDSLRTLTSLALRKPEAFTYGVLKNERLSGCLLYGPPGTGKTMLGKAIAKESGCLFLEVHPAMINDMWVGNSEKRVHALFRLAGKVSKKTPLVLFLDEGDALLRDRNATRATVSGGRREVITEFLRGWDGLVDNRAFVIVSTNRPGDLDEAVVRRLSRRVLVDLPLRDERAAIVRNLLRGERLAPDLDVDALAARTELYSGSDLKNLCVAAATEAVRLEMLAEEKEKRELERLAKEEEKKGQERRRKEEQEKQAEQAEQAEQARLQSTADATAKEEGGNAVTSAADTTMTVERTEADKLASTAATPKTEEAAPEQSQSQQQQQQPQAPAQTQPTPSSQPQPQPQPPLSPQLPQSPPPPPLQPPIQPSNASNLSPPDPSPSPLPLPPKPRMRVLTAAHFEKALGEMGASISEDMESVKALRVFDQKYGDSGRRKKNKVLVGLGGITGPARTGSGEARVRQTPVGKPR